MTAHVDLQIACEADNLPTIIDFETWLNTVTTEDIEVCIRIVTETESQMLNKEFRGKDKPTNVLSFHYDHDDDIHQQDEEVKHLGDLVICADIIAAEAKAQHKDLLAHWAHMMVHGVLHLQGHDHQTDAEAVQMESLEVNIIENLGFRNPYLVD